MAWPVRCRMCGVARALDHRLRGGVDAADGLAADSGLDAGQVGVARRRPQGRLLGAGPAAEPGALVLDGQPVQARDQDVHQHVALADARRRTRHRHAATRTPGRSASRPGSPRTARPESARRLPAPIARPSRNPAPAPAARDGCSRGSVPATSRPANRSPPSPRVLPRACASAARGIRGCRAAGAGRAAARPRRSAPDCRPPRRHAPAPGPPAPGAAPAARAAPTAAAGARPSADARRRS